MYMNSFSNIFQFKNNALIFEANLNFKTNEKKWET